MDEQRRDGQVGARSRIDFSVLELPVPLQQLAGDGSKIGWDLAPAQPFQQSDGTTAYLLGHCRSVLAYDVAVGKGGEKAEKDSERAPARIVRALTRRSEQWLAAFEYVDKIGIILGGNAVAVGGLGHRLAQRHVRRREYVVALHASQPGRIREHDGAKRQLGILYVEIDKDARERGPQVRCRALGGRRQWGAQQHNSEIGIGGADRLSGRFHGAEDACADTRSVPREGAGGSGGALFELCRRHAMSGGEQMDVARLRGLEFVAAGRHECRGDPARRQVHARALGYAASGSAERKSPTRTDAMFARVTDCSPDQAGMLLTSSTVGRPSASWRMSTPAKLAPTASAARTASSPICRSETTAMGRPPRFTLVIQVGDWRIIAATTRPSETSNRKSRKPSRSTPTKRWR